MSDIIEEEVLEQGTQPTEEEAYNSEYDSAWDDEEQAVEQPNDEEELSDEIEESEATEDSTDLTADDKPVEDAENDDKEQAEEPSEDFAETLKWKGKEIPVTREELIVLGQKGFDAEKKWQEAALNRPIKEVVDKYKLTAEQMTMLGDIVLNKNPEALALLAEQNGIDLFDAEKKNYQPVVEEKNYALDDVIAEINQNEEIAQQMNEYVSSVPQSVKDVLTSQPEVLKGLNEEMLLGRGQKIMPEVIKQLAINPNHNFLDLYQGIGRRMFSQEEKTQDKVEITEPKSTREDKKRVAIPKNNATPKKAIADDYDAAWDDNDQFNAVLSRLNGFN